MNWCPFPRHVVCSDPSTALKIIKQRLIPFLSLLPSTSTSGFHQLVEKTYFPSLRIVRAVSHSQATATLFHSASSLMTVIIELASVAVAFAKALPVVKSVAKSAMDLFSSRKKKKERKELQALALRQVQTEQQHNEQLTRQMSDEFRTLQQMARRHEAQMAQASRVHQQQQQGLTELLNASLATIREHFQQCLTLAENTVTAHGQQRQEMQGQFLVFMGVIGLGLLTLCRVAG